jgi:predicted Zn-dependent protease
MWRSSRLRMVHMAAAVVGLVAVAFVYEAAEHGGDLVYSYAGGPGIRSGDPQDVQRLLLAGLYHQTLKDREAGNLAQAGELASFAARRFPNDTEVRLFAAESLLLDRKDPQAAIAALATIDVPPDNRILRIRRATLQADAFEQAGQKDAAVAVLQPIVEAYPTNTRLKQRLDELKGAGPAEAR